MQIQSELVDHLGGSADPTYGPTSHSTSPQSKWSMLKPFSTLRSSLCFLSMVGEMNTHGLMDPHVRWTDFKWKILSTYPTRNPPSGPTPVGRAHKFERAVSRPLEVLHRLHHRLFACPHAQAWSPPSIKVSLEVSLIIRLKMKMARIADVALWVAPMASPLV
jgi:hypothetical protein